MDSLEILKQELLFQKEEIINKGGSVSIASVNPSPSEITAGIKTISVPNLSSATAMADDVVEGKTFYSGNGEIKTGTKVVPDLSQADAQTNDVAEGKTFYAGDNSIKVGTMVIPDLSQADAEENNVEIGKTFYSGNNELKTGTREIPDLTVATATEQDVAQGKTFYAGDNTVKTGVKADVDFSVATATVEDVVEGKTFYAGDGTLKTGTKDSSSSAVDNDLFYKLFVSNEEFADEQFDYTIPNGTKAIKSYWFYESAKHVNLTFNPDLEEISNQAFSKAVNINFTNFEELQQVKLIKSGAFGELRGKMCLENLSPVLAEMQQRVFYNSVKANTSIVLPKTLAKIGISCMAMQEKTEMKSLVMPDDIQYSSFGSYSFQNLLFDCDLVLPHSITTVPAVLFYGTSFNNITIHGGVTSFGVNAFNMLTSDSVSYRRLKTVTFEGETPPTFAANPFSVQDQTNNFKIYVPDNSIDEYKSALSDFGNYVYPVSQKD